MKEMKEKFWYFNFEGKFAEDALEYKGEGVFSSCLVPENNLNKAKSLFAKALLQNRINLLEIIEYYPIIYEDLDSTNPQHNFWFRWYNEALNKGQPIFDVWHLYSEDL